LCVGLIAIVLGAVCRAGMTATVFGEREYKLLLCGMNCMVLYYTVILFVLSKENQCKRGKKLMLLIIYYEEK